MKLKAIFVVLLLVCSTLLASPGKHPPCPNAQAAAVSINEAGTAAAFTDDSDLLPMHRFAGTVL